jgi:hypothetical protein
MTCTHCGGALGTQAAQVIRVCTGCIQAADAPRLWPRPPGYTWNRPPTDAEGPGVSEPPPLASFD